MRGLDRETKGKNKKTSGPAHRNLGSEKPNLGKRGNGRKGRRKRNKKESTKKKRGVTGDLRTSGEHWSRKNIESREESRCRTGEFRKCKKEEGRETKTESLCEGTDTQGKHEKMHT